jgi:hypothetical protein
MDVIKLFFASLLAIMAFSLPQGASAQMTPSGDNVTFQIFDANGESLGSSTVPAEQALGTVLATFFAELAKAIKEIFRGQDRLVATKDVWISDRVFVRVTGVGTGAGGGQPSSN